MERFGESFWLITAKAMLCANLYNYAVVQSEQEFKQSLFTILRWTECTTANISMDTTWDNMGSIGCHMGIWVLNELHMWAYWQGIPMLTCVCVFVCVQRRIGSWGRRDATSLKPFRASFSWSLSRRLEDASKWPVEWHTQHRHLSVLPLNIVDQN